MTTTDIQYKENTSMMYFSKSSDDTTLGKNLCDYTLFNGLHNIEVVSEYKRHTSTRSFLALDKAVKTSLHPLSGTKKYIQFLGKDEIDLIKVTGFIKEIQSLYIENSDKALVHIFDVIDEWDDIEDLNRFETLFIYLKDFKFNEDIYISLLASTISLKNNVLRKEYFNYVKKELNSFYSSEELSKLLIGL